MEGNDENKEGENEEEEEKVYIDPKLLKPDLYAAAAANDTIAVIEYLDQQVPGTFIDTKNGWTALHWAAINGNVKMLKKLLDCKASEPYHRLMQKEKKLKLLESQSGDHHRKGRKNKGSHGDENGSSHEEKFETIAEREGEDDEEYEEEDDANMDLDKQIEVSVNLLKNTPLLWATHKGHLRVMWHLLADGYSPNDVDNMGNTALHLAAATGDLKILKVLIDDGASANIVNLYKNLPIDMAKNRETRDILALAMEAGASMTEEDMALKHELNMKQFRRIESSLQTAVSEASTINSPRAMKNMTVNHSTKLARVLSDALAVGKEFSLDEELIAQGDSLLLKLEASQDLITDVINVQQIMPIRTQSVYIDKVYKLERSIERAEAVGIDRSQLQIGLDLIKRCQVEYFLAIWITRLKDVVTADDSNDYDMKRLSDAIRKAQSLSANEELIEEGVRFESRFKAELGMSRAIKALPSVKPYVETPVDGYYDERDAGKIKETDEYPLLPADCTEYIWIPAEAYTALANAIDNIKLSYNGAEALGANPSIIAETKEKLLKAEKDLKMLELKEAHDKTLATDAAKKAAKKLKKGKGKKK